MSNSARQPAYPVSAKVERDFINGGWGSPGLTKRELIAAMAMQGLLTGYDVNDVLAAAAARDAVACADALLAELERRDD